MIEGQLVCLSHDGMPVFSSVAFVILLKMPMLALGWSNTVGSLVGPQDVF